MQHKIYCAFTSTRSSIKDMEKTYPDLPPLTGEGDADESSRSDDDVSLEAREFIGRPDVHRVRDITIVSNLIEATALYAWFRRQAEIEEGVDAATGALAVMDQSFQALGLRKSRTGNWALPSLKRGGDTMLFKLSPQASLLVQQGLRPLYTDPTKRVAQRIYSNVYDQVSRPIE